MKNSKNKKTGLLLTLLIGILIVGYKTLFVEPIDEFALSSELAQSESVVMLLGELERVNFDTSVLKEPVFSTLISIETPLPVLPVGKANPFSATSN